LQDYPKCDASVQKLAGELWGDCDGKTIFAHAYGKGRVLWRETEVKPLAEYGDYAAVTNVLGQTGVGPDFSSDGPIRFTHRRTGDTDIYFLANREARAVETVCRFRISSRQPELWNPETGKISPLALFEQTLTEISAPLRFEAHGSTFVVFRSQKSRLDSVTNFLRNGQPVLLSSQPPVIKIKRATFGVLGDIARTRDVRATVQALVDGGQVAVQVNKLVAGGDPAYGVIKTLDLEYTVDDQPFKLIGWEPDTIGLVTGIFARARAADIRSVSVGQFEIVAAQPGNYEVKTAAGKKLTAEITSVPEVFEVVGAWDVSFPPKWGAPDKITLDSLASLSDSADAGVKFFSGPATYTKMFDWNPAAQVGNQKSEQWLDLGDVQVMAQVKLNGHDLGTLWQPPFRVEVSSALQAGHNTLEVRVANLWPNRMIGDQALPEAERFTWSSYQPFTKDSSLPKSVLIGPVKIQTAQIVTPQ
jgi:hypothetical protein